MKALVDFLFEAGFLKRLARSGYPYLGFASDPNKSYNVFRGMYFGGDRSTTSPEWVEENVRTNHGPLGKLYPRDGGGVAGMKEGDTPSWFYFLPNGLGDPEQPSWGGWGGRFGLFSGRNQWNDATDTVGSETSPQATVWRWRPAFNADFQARAGSFMTGTMLTPSRPSGRGKPASSHNVG